jgi:hypothetical protein
MKKITLKSFCIICGIVMVAGFAGEKFQSVDLIKSNKEDGLRIIRKTWWGLKTEQLEIGSGEWKKVKG